jgi:small subunit ribosomal protein S4
MHGQNRVKLSTYGMQLREKQRAKRIYGILERQFRRYYKLAARYTGATGAVLLQLLERRLDNVVYRVGFAASRRAARQLIRHGHLRVNGRRVDIPSYLVRPNDALSLSEPARQNTQVLSSLNSQAARGRKPWITFDDKEYIATFLSVPNREDLDDVDVREQLIVELYSK